VNRNPVPRVSLRERPRPILRAFPLVDDGDDGPGHARLHGDGLITRPDVGRDEMSGHDGKIAGQLGFRPAPRIRCPEGCDVCHCFSIPERSAGNAKLLLVITAFEEENRTAADLCQPRIESRNLSPTFVPETHCNHKANMSVNIGYQPVNARTAGCCSGLLTLVGEHRSIRLLIQAADRAVFGPNLRSYIQRSDDMRLIAIILLVVACCMLVALFPTHARSACAVPGSVPTLFGYCAK